MIWEVMSKSWSVIEYTNFTVDILEVIMGIVGLVLLYKIYRKVK
ncbi:MAG TPA: hypothetical protein VMV86_03230 [Methanosarcinales archaeon]|nr:hypothetical protein [Methanosarcinales archaeon]